MLCIHYNFFKILFDVLYINPLTFLTAC